MKSTTPRLERHLLRLQHYQFIFRYERAPNPADYGSRYNLTTSPASSGTKQAEAYIHLVAKASVYASAVTLDDVEKSSMNDGLVKKLLPAIQSDFKDVSDEHLKTFHKFKEELSILSQPHAHVVLRGNRVYIPQELRQRVLRAAHEAHQGISKTKSLMRQTVWWPKMDEEVENLVKGCVPCLANTTQNPPEPLIMSKMPSRPWDIVQMDFWGPAPTGEKILVLRCEATRWPEIAIMHSTKLESTVQRIDEICARNGFPTSLYSDNGPPMNSKEHFGKFCETRGIDWHTRTPLWPQADSLVESFMKPMGKAIRCAHAEKRNWRVAVHQFLQAYRATPVSTTGVSPSVLWFGRNIRTKLPAVHEEMNNLNLWQKAMRRDEQQKSKQKKYTDARRRARPSSIKEGDKVLVLIPREKRNKLSSKYYTEELTVLRRKGNMVQAQFPDGKEITRNVSHYKLVGKCG